MSKRQRTAPAKMADIAKLAGVHASTVSRALAGSPLVEQSMREKILKIAQQHGYVVNATARNLRLKRTQTLSVVIPLGHEAGQTLADPFFMQMLGHLADEITQRGYGMFLQKVMPLNHDWLAQLIASQQSDGIIVIGQSTEHEALQAAAKRYLPLVVWGGHWKQQGYCVVGTDNVAGARAAVEHLLQTGRRRIVFLGDPSVPEIGLRHDGYLAALEHAPRNSSGDRIVAAHMTADTAYKAVRSFIRKGNKFDAMFASTDVIALSAIRAITASGLSVPQDVAVVGFDDVAMSAHVTPTLTTVHQDLGLGAKILVDSLVRRIEGEDTASIMMPAKLIVRESSESATNK